MSIITPYSTLAKQLFNPAKFPALKLYFPCTEDDTTAYLTDLVNGITLSDPPFYTKHSGSTKSIVGLVNNVIMLSGVLPPTPGTKKVIFIYTGVPATTSSYLQVGDNVDGIKLAAPSTGAKCTVYKGGVATVSTTGLASTGAQLQTFMGIIDIGTSGLGGTYGLTLCDYDGTTFTQRAAIDISTAVTSLNPFTADSLTVMAAVKPGTIQMWYFTAVPADYKAAMLWIHANIAAGVHSPYPGWMNKV